MSAFMDRIGDTRIIYFPANGNRVKLERMPNTEIYAIDADNYDYDYPVGMGQTQLEAIADLTEKMVERGLWEGERD